MPRTGVMLLGFGGPDSIESVQPFMCNLMGRVPSPELVDRICGNYEAIGGRSPLAGIASAIGEELHARLGVLGHDVPVRVGMRYWHPYIADSLDELAALGCVRIVTASLSPFESKVASGAYRDAMEEALLADDLGGLEVVEAPLASSLPEFAQFLAESTEVALGTLPDPTGAFVAFTAHSLPESDLVDDDPYVAGLQATASAVATRLGWEPGATGAGGGVLGGFEAFGSVEGAQPWLMVYQSKGARPGAWLGPSLDELIEALGHAGVGSLVVCPIGFMTDHMETLFDLDTVAAVKAAEAGVAFVRAPVPNADPLVVDALAEAVSGLL